MAFRSLNLNRSAILLCITTCLYTISFTTLKLIKKTYKKDLTTTQKCSDNLVQPEDFNTLINLRNFTFLYSYMCTKPLDLVILTSSAPENKERRDAIRETWGGKRDDVKLFFMIGVAKNQTLQGNIRREYQKHSDIIQGNFLDSYKNLTYKFIMGFKFVIYFCSRAKFILKTDDDTFVNMPVFMKYLKSISIKHKISLISCNIMYPSPPIREFSKWHVSFDEYPPSIYPPYCSGFAVLFAYKTIFNIYREAQRGDFFWVDDAFVTGNYYIRKIY